ncbi:hypothetical protein [Azospirillum oleiclasticum]
MTGPDQPRCPLDAMHGQVVGILRRTFQRRRPDGALPRFFHEKSHGCLRGTFRVEPPVDPALRQGLFAVPAEYPALVRFSSGMMADDREPDTRGLGIKLSGVPGPVCDGAPAGQQDFLMISQPAIPTRDVTEAVEYFGKIDGARAITPLTALVPSYLMPGFRPWRTRWQYLALIMAAIRAHLRGWDLARLTYYGVTPYRLGEGAMLYRCQPDPATFARRRPRGRSFAERLQATLDDGPLAFDFLIQPRQGETDPLDRIGVPWTGPLLRVARLEIPPQSVSALLPTGDRLTMSPWNALKAHEPLGSINALRRTVYHASATDRGADPLFPTTLSPRGEV